MERTEQKNTGMLVTIIILVIAVLGLGGYLVYDKVIEKDEPKVDNTQETDENVQNENTDNDNVVENENSNNVENNNTQIIEKEMTADEKYRIFADNMKKNMRIEGGSVIYTIDLDGRYAKNVSSVEVNTNGNIYLVLATENLKNQYNNTDNGSYKLTIDNLLFTDFVTSDGQGFTGLIFIKTDGTVSKLSLNDSNIQIVDVPNVKNIVNVVNRYEGIGGASVAKLIDIDGKYYDLY